MKNYLNNNLYRIIAGVDEAGRGPLAGPVVAAAVIIDNEKLISEIQDSKSISEKKRQQLYDFITTHADSYGIGLATAEEIDTFNILQATFLAMQRAVQKLKIKPEIALIDGNRAPLLECETKAIIKGDRDVPLISAASILAKVYRDRLMLKLDQLYPQYGFAQHKGYPTKSHIEMIEKWGITPEHRKTFQPIKALQDINKILLHDAKNFEASPTVIK